MNKAKKIIEKLNSYLEALKSIKLDSPVKGLGFIDRKPTTVPKGDYTNLGPDEVEPKKYVILSNDKTNELFIVDKKFVK